MAVRGMRSEIAVVQHVGVGDTLYVGTIAGSVGGALLLIFAMGKAVLNGMDILSPLRLIGATFIGAGALDGGGGVIFYGLLVQAATAMVWGILFAAILPRHAPLNAALIAGLVYGLLVMLVMLFVVLPGRESSDARSCPWNDSIQHRASHLWGRSGTCPGAR